MASAVWDTPSLSPVPDTMAACGAATTRFATPTPVDVTVNPAARARRDIGFDVMGIPASVQIGASPPCRDRSRERRPLPPPGVRHAGGHDGHELNIGLQ